MPFTKKVAAEGSMVHFRRALSVWCVPLAVGWAAAIAAPPEDLFNAANSGDAATVQALLAKGADVNAKDTTGWTALMFAAATDYTGTVQVLLKKGANVNAKNNKGETALMIATFYKHPDIVKILKDAGAKE